MPVAGFGQLCPVLQFRTQKVCWPYVLSVQPKTTNVFCPPLNMLLSWIPLIYVFFFFSIFISAFSFPLPGPYGLFQYTCLCFSVIGPRTLLFSHSDSKRISTSTCQKSKFQLFPQETISFVSYPHQQSISHPTS